MINIFKKHSNKTQPANAPSFLIIGAQKAGTTTLFDMLNSIKGFSGASVKEPGFFSKDKFYDQDNDWYLEHFKHSDKEDITFEATPEYLYYDFVPKRIYHFNMGMKFIVLLREPVERCLSAWNMFRTFNINQPEVIYEQFMQDANPEIREVARELLFSKNFPSFEAAVFDDLDRVVTGCPLPEPSFVRRGLYYQQLVNYLKYFDISNFLFLEQNELSSPEDVFNKLGKFLAVKIDLSGITEKKSNAGLYEACADDVSNVLDCLKEFYRPHNENLFKLVGQRYNWNDQ